MDTKEDIKTIMGMKKDAHWLESLIGVTDKLGVKENVDLMLFAAIAILIEMNNRLEAIEAICLGQSLR